MAELKLGTRTVDLPFMARLYDVTEKLFDELDDPDTRAELTDGVMIVHGPTSMQHDSIDGFIHTLITCYAEENDLGSAYGPNCLFRPKKGRRYAPDVFFLKPSRMPSPLPKVFEGIPDLIVEVLSPSNRDYDLKEKRPIYQQLGVPEIWLVDPQQESVLCDRLGPIGRYETLEMSAGRIESRVLPGFWLDVSWLWQSPPPKVLQCLRKILAAHS